MEIIGPLQVRIMNIIWTKDMVTVHDVHGSLNAEPGVHQLAYTTVLTVMRNLVRRGLLSQNPTGRTHIFTPTSTAEEYKKSLMQDVCDEFFGGDIDALVRLTKGIGGVEKYATA